MTKEESKRCVECEGIMSRIIIMDKDRFGITAQAPQSLEYRRPDDSRSFWTGRYPTAGPVRAFMCSECGRIALYGTPDAHD